MSDHEKYSDLIPLYAAGSLDESQRLSVERHLTVCSVCRADKAFWTAVSKELAASHRNDVLQAAPLDRALSIVIQDTRRPAALRHAIDLLMSQTLLVRREIWLAVAAVTVIGFAAALVSGSAAIIRFLSPLIAATSLAVICGPENDPSLELTLATTTSIWKILLARLTLVFGFNLILALASLLGLRAFLPGGVMQGLILDWLAPMTFLSAVAFVLSLWIGTGNAVAAAYLAWLVRFLPKGLIQRIVDSSASPALAGAFASYRRFWSSPELLFSLSAAMIAAALWLSNRPKRGLSRRISMIS